MKQNVQGYMRLVYLIHLQPVMQNFHIVESVGSDYCVSNVIWKKINLLVNIYGISFISYYYLWKFLF